MTTIKFEYESNLLVEVSGHSGYKSSGSDIICAGISVACLMTANLIDRLGYNIIEAKKDDETGYFKLVTENNSTALEIYKNLEDTLRDIANNNPKYVKFKN